MGSHRSLAATSISRLLGAALLSAGLAEAAGAQNLPEESAGNYRAFSWSTKNQARPKYPIEAKVEGKIGPAVAAMLLELKGRGITRANARAQGATGLSNPFLRIDQDGAIQVYLHLANAVPLDLESLARHEARVEIVNEELGLVPAWIPFDRIEEVAELRLVERITRPSYARIREGSATTEGDMILKADQACEALRADGTGVQVGIISPGRSTSARRMSAATCRRPRP